MVKWGNLLYGDFAAAGSVDGAVPKPDKLVDDVDFGGLSLEAFVGDGQYEGEVPSLASRPGSVQPVEECGQLWNHPRMHKS